jgi:hypothetical protein
LVMSVRLIGRGRTIPTKLLAKLLLAILTFLPPARPRLLSDGVRVRKRVTSHSLTYTYPSIVGDLRTSTSIFIAFILIVPIPARVATCHSHDRPIIPTSVYHHQYQWHLTPHIDSLFNNPANCKENGDTGRPGSGLRGVQDDAGGRTGHPRGEHQSGAPSVPR